MKIIKKGQKFNNLTILKEIAPYISPKGSVARKFLCKCICGKRTEVILNNLTRDHTRSCGCLQREKNKKRSYKHGMSPRGIRNRFYFIFKGMEHRCKDKDNHLYGGKGVRCEWKTVKEFKEDMYKDYLKHCKKHGEKNTSIDRINGLGNYCKKNTRWATPKVQRRNSSCLRFLTFNNKTQILVDWADELGIRPCIISTRLRRGWTVERALSI